MAGETNGSGTGSVATIRELNKAIQEQDERHARDLQTFRTEMTTRLDLVLANQQRAEVIAAERTGRDDARIKSLELAVMKVGDETAVVAGLRLETATIKDDVKALQDENTRREWKAWGTTVAAGLMGAGTAAGIFKALGL